MVLEERDELLRKICGVLIRHLIMAEVPRKDLWPSDVDAEIYSLFPAVSQGDSHWNLQFNDFIVHVIKSTNPSGRYVKFLPASNLSSILTCNARLEDMFYAQCVTTVPSKMDIRGRITNVYVTDELQIHAHSKGDAFDQCLDLSLNLISGVRIEESVFNPSSEGLDLIDMIIDVLDVEDCLPRLNSAPIKLSEIRLTLYGDKEASCLAQEILEQRPDIKYRDLKRRRAFVAQDILALGFLSSEADEDEELGIGDGKIKYSQPTQLVNEDNEGMLTTPQSSDSKARYRCDDGNPDLDECEFQNGSEGIYEASPLTIASSHLRHDSPHSLMLQALTEMEENSGTFNNHSEMRIDLEDEPIDTDHPVTVPGKISISDDTKKSSGIVVRDVNTEVLTPKTINGANLNNEAVVEQSSSDPLQAADEKIPEKNLSRKEEVVQHDKVQNVSTTLSRTSHSDNKTVTDLSLNAIIIGASTTISSGKDQADENTLRRDEKSSISRDRKMKAQPHLPMRLPNKTVISREEDMPRHSSLSEDVTNLKKNGNNKYPPPLEGEYSERHPTELFEGRKTVRQVPRKKQYGGKSKLKLKAKEPLRPPRNVTTTETTTAGTKNLPPRRSPRLSDKVISKAERSFQNERGRPARNRGEEEASRNFRCTSELSNGDSTAENETTNRKEEEEHKLAAEIASYQQPLRRSRRNAEKAFSESKTRIGNHGIVKAATTSTIHPKTKRSSPRTNGTEPSKLNHAEPRTPDNIHKEPDKDFLKLETNDSQKMLLPGSFIDKPLKGLTELHCEPPIRQARPQNLAERFAGIIQEHLTMNQTTQITDTNQQSPNLFKSASQEPRSKRFGEVPRSTRPTENRQKLIGKMEMVSSSPKTYHHKPEKNLPQIPLTTNWTVLADANLTPAEIPSAKNPDNKDGYLVKDMFDRRQGAEENLHSAGPKQPHGYSTNPHNGSSTRTMTKPLLEANSRLQEQKAVDDSLHGIRIYRAKMGSTSSPLRRSPRLLEKAQKDSARMTDVTEAPTPLIDDQLARKTALVEFGETGPHNQGLTSVLKIPAIRPRLLKETLIKKTPPRGRSQGKRKRADHGELLVQSGGITEGQDNCLHDREKVYHSEVSLPEITNCKSLPLRPEKRRKTDSQLSHVDENGSPIVTAGSYVNQKSLKVICRKLLSSRQTHCKEQHPLGLERNDNKDRKRPKQHGGSDQEYPVAHFQRPIPIKALATGITPPSKSEVTSRTSALEREAEFGYVPHNTIPDDEHARPRKKQAFVSEQDLDPFTKQRLRRPESAFSRHLRSLIMQEDACGQEQGDNDPEKTLIDTENQFPFEDYASSMTGSSNENLGKSPSLNELAGTDIVHIPTPEEEWREALRPHQRNLVDSLYQICNVCTIHMIVDAFILIWLAGSGSISHPRRGCHR